MSKRLIYGLLDPRTTEIRYIGKSTYGLERPKRHQRRSILKRDHKSNWLRQLFDAGLTCDIIVLERLREDQDINEREISWIAYGKSLGWRLTNLTVGGDGSAGYTLSDERKDRIGAVHRGKTVSVETREKISAGMGTQVVDITTETTYRSIQEAAKAIGGHVSCVCRVLKGVQRQTKGHIFRYAGPSTSTADAAFLSA